MMQGADPATLAFIQELREVGLHVAPADQRECNKQLR